MGKRPLYRPRLRVIVGFQGVSVSLLLAVLQVMLFGVNPFDRCAAEHQPDREKPSEAAVLRLGFRDLGSAGMIVLASVTLNSISNRVCSVPLLVAEVAFYV